MAMTSRKYPRIGLVTRRSRTKIDGATTCDNCGRAITPGAGFGVVDVQTSRMRGDDEIATVCNACSRTELDAGKLLAKVELDSENRGAQNATV